MKFKKKIFEIIHPSSNSSGLFMMFDVFIILLIISNVLALIFQSVESIGIKYYTFFVWFEQLSVTVFSFEYILRLWTCNEISKYSGKYGRIKWMSSPMAVIDLLAILPFYLPFIGMDLRFIRILRIFRMLRLLKLSRYSSAMSIMKSVFMKKRVELGITLMLSLVLLVIFSTFMYYAERDSQPEIFGSIPDSMWWGVVTMTTIGYGDTYPITVTGKIIAGIIALISIGLFALPTGILASGFSSEIESRKKE